MCNKLCTESWVFTHRDLQISTFVHFTMTGADSISLGQWTSPTSHCHLHKENSFLPRFFLTNGRSKVSTYPGLDGLIHISCHKFTQIFKSSKVPMVTRWLMIWSSNVSTGVIFLVRRYFSCIISKVYKHTQAHSRMTSTGNWAVMENVKFVKMTSHQEHLWKWANSLFFSHRKGMCRVFLPPKLKKPCRVMWLVQDVRQCLCTFICCRRDTYNPCFL